MGEQIENDNEFDEPVDQDLFTILVAALFTDKGIVAVELIEHANTATLQRMVDVGDRMKEMAQAEAGRRKISLFSPWRSFMLGRKEGMQ